MKNILYLTNIEVPYRNRFFNELAKHCNLTVFYERRNSSNRNSKWANAETKNYTNEYLDGINIGNENAFSLHIISILRRKWDLVVIGCYNSIVQILAMAYLKLKNVPFIINLDGEPFIGNGIKAFVKKKILTGAEIYLTAGIKASKSLRKAIGNNHSIIPYYFSSLANKEIKNNAEINTKRENFVLVVGQYLEYKGLDVAFKIACMDMSIQYKFVGMGQRTNLFTCDMGKIPKNVEIIPFLQKKELEIEYQKCALMLLPSRKECWGLVVNEAASFGTPIVSTWGSGAAIEFLSNKYSHFLAKPGDTRTLYECVHRCLESDNSLYSEYLKNTSKYYTIERNVDEHLKAFGII